MKALRSFFGSPYFILVLPPLFWSGNMIAGRFVSNEIPPFTLSFCRWLIVFLLLLPFVIREAQTQLPLLKGNFTILVVFALLGIVSYNSLAYLALKYTTATNTSLLNSFIPITTIILSWLFLKKSISRKKIIGVIISSCGVIIIICHGSFPILLSLKFNRGDILMLLAVIVWAVYTISLAYRPSGVNALFLLATMTGIGLVMLFPLMIYEILFIKFFTVNLQNIMVILYIGIFPGLIGQLAYNQGVKMVGANIASLFIHLMSVFSAILAYFILSEKLEYFHYIGISLILSGIFLTINKSSMKLDLIKLN